MFLDITLVRSKLTLTLRDSNNQLVARETSSFRTNKDFINVSRTLGIEYKTLQTIIDEYERDGKTRFEIVLIENSLKITIANKAGIETDSRGLSTRESLIEYLQEKLIPVDEELFMVWDNDNALCAVDVDVEANTTGFDLDSLEMILARLTPIPHCSWITKSGGLRFLYLEQDGFSAKELCSLCILNLSNTILYKQIELKSETRLPVNPVKFTQQTISFDAIGSFLKQYSIEDSLVQEFLESNDLELGVRYGHEKCPVKPSKSGKNNPVVINDNGIFCFICQSNGVIAGSSKPGFFPYSYLCGEDNETVFLTLIQNFVHFEHAKHILASLFKLDDIVIRNIYKACFKLMYKTDPRTTLVFSEGKNIVRFNRYWVNHHGESYQKEINRILQYLPSCQEYINNELVVNQQKLVEFEQAFDLSQYGYYELTPIFGQTIFYVHNEVCKHNYYPKIIQNHKLAKDNLLHYWPKYQPGNIDQAWAVINSIFPGIEKNLVYLLIAAKGFSESAISLPPMIFINGPTSSAKTSTVEIASAICGDSNTNIVWTNNIDRIRQQIIEAKYQGSFVTFNEITKEASQRKIPNIQSMDFLLNLTPNSTSWKIYVGSIRLGQLPVFVWTDTEIPDEIQSDAQLSRRLVQVNLPKQVDWQQSAKDNSLAHFDELRLLSKDVAYACNTILSYVIDTYFSSPMSFEDVVIDLGYNYMNNSIMAQNDKQLLKDFFDEVCKQIDTDETDQRRLGGRGWKKIDKRIESTILNLWEMLNDETIGGRWITSRKCSSIDWSRIISVSIPVNFEVRNNGNNIVFVRFIHRENKHNYLVNEELKG